MTSTDERPTIGELYGVATSSGNLRVQERRTDADIIMAAGMSAHPLGVMLLRLQAEYDGARQEIEHAEATARAADMQAKRLVNDPDGVSLAAAIRKRSAGEITTARYLILSQMQTLRKTKEEVGAFAEEQATRQKFMKPHAVVAKLAGQVLDVLLDPTCDRCDGSAVEGSGYRGEIQQPCRACRETGQRRYSLGADERSRWFAAFLLGELQREMAHAAGGMGRLLA